MALNIDEIQLNFSDGSLLFMNICLGFIMFGVSLDIKWSHFKELSRNPKPTLVGILSQFLLLPILTLLLVYIIRPHNTIALGMFLLAAVPGGNISNFMTNMARGNTALSVSLTAFSSLFSIVLTPLNFGLWASFYPPTRVLLREISLDPTEVFKVILLLLIIPLIAGIAFAKQFPQLTDRIKRPIKLLSIVIFLGFVAVAFSNNYDNFLLVIKIVVFYVMIMHSAGLAGGYLLGKAFKLDRRNCRTVAIETSIQNSGLGLILIFNFFDGLGGMAVMAAWWSIWHILVGLAISTYWSKYPKNWNYEGQVSGQ